MRTTGMTRPLDPLGRIVIPKEIRNVMNLNEGDRIEILTDNDTIVLRKYNPCCMFCGESNDLVSFNGKKICRDCATAIGDEVK